MSIPNDKKTFEKAFREIYPTAVLYARRITSDLETAKDIAQQVFINIFEKRDRLNIDGSLKAYVLRAVRNTALNHIKKEETLKKHNQQAFNLYENLNQEYEDDNYEKAIRILYEHIEALPPRCKQIFKMNRFDGKRNGEIAEELGISIRTVETQISNALKALRTNMPKGLL